MSTPTVTFHNFNPDSIAQFMMQKDWKGCWGYIEQLIESFSITKHGQHGLDMQLSMSDEETRDYLNNFSGLMAELLLSLLTEPSVKIPDQNFYRLMSLHEIIHNFFYLKGFNDTKPLVDGIVQNNKSLTPLQQKKMLLLLSLDTPCDIAALLKKVDGSYRSYALSCYLSYIKIYRQNIHDNKVALLQQGHHLKRLSGLLEQQDLQPQLLANLMETYFTCSYLDCENKHAIKRDINGVLQNYYANFRRKMKKAGVAAQALPSAIKNTDPDKKKLLIVLEQFAEGHAMKRSWAPWIKSLESHFHVVLLLKSTQYYDALGDEFQCCTFESLAQFIGMIESYAPDMLVLPSVGLSFWGVSAANMRLAPLQLMTLGHPASTMSQHIDMVYGQEILYHEGAFGSEKYVVDNSPYRFLPNLTKAQINAIPCVSYKAGSDAPLNVSIVCAESKLTGKFIALLKEIKEQSPFAIAFSFHVGSMGMDSFILEKHLRAELGELSFTGYQLYEEFMASIGRSDIVLNPFPFGHTNTIIDTLLLGKPCVSLEGDEPSSRTELYILDVLGLTDMFSTRSLDAYKERFFSLATRIMAGDTVFYDRTKIYDDLYDQSTIPDIDYGANMKVIYDHASKIMESSDQLINFESFKTQK